MNKAKTQRSTFVISGLILKASSSLNEVTGVLSMKVWPKPRRKKFQLWEKRETRATTSRRAWEEKEARDENVVLIPFDLILPRATPFHPMLYRVMRRYKTERLSYWPTYGKNTRRRHTDFLQSPTQAHRPDTAGWLGGREKLRAEAQTHTLE